MKLIITQPEIEAIVRAHVENTVSLREGAEMKIDFTATRSEDGITATIDIPYMGVAGIPAIAAAVEAAAASQAPAPVKPPVTRAKPVTKGNAASVLGGGTTPATDTAANPEPTNEEAQETAQDAAGDAQEAQGSDAPAETSEAAQATAPASSRGPSLFGSFLAR